MKGYFVKKLFILGVIVGVLFSGIYLVDAADIKIVPHINPNIPGMNVATQENPNPVGIIANLFQFALLIGGLLAFVMIVYGGIKYAASGDSGSGMKEAREIIEQALLGLLLLAGAFVLLQTINPQLTRLSFPELEDIMQADLALPTGPNNVCPTGTTPQSCAQQNSGAGYCHRGGCYGNNEGPFAGTIIEPKEKGGRCVNNECNAGLFCFKDNKCYQNIECSPEDNEIYPVNENDECETKLKQMTGVRVDATCNVDRVCMLYGTFETFRCEDASDCSSSETCVAGSCKFNGTEGARCRNGICTESGTECSASGFCVREFAIDTTCGDQKGTCEQGNCLMDRANIGKFACSTTLGADGVCPQDMGGSTPQAILSCNNLQIVNGKTGGYCHQGSCYGNDGGDFPISTGPNP